MSSNKDIGGWLRKKGHRLHTWSRKWFLLRDKSLMIYSKESDVKCLETIHLDKQTLVEPPIDPNDPKRGYFDIINGNETISLCADTAEEKQTWLKALKRVLYAKRGGALFSQSLEEILFWEKASGRRVPYIVDECVQYLYKYGLDVEGIFRLGGRLATIKDVISRFDKGEKIEFEKEETDVHVVASVLKSFLRDLPDSIIPCQFYQKFMNIALRFMDAQDDDAKKKCVTDLTTAMDLIPDDNYVILKYVCDFLKKVSDREDTNKMTMMNLGTIFGNNIIRHVDKENSQLLLCTADLGQNLVFMLLNYFPQVFIRELKEEKEEDSRDVNTEDGNHDIATADLLHMSEETGAPISDCATEQNICEDLKGIDLTNQTSNRSLKVIEDFYSEPKDDNILLSGNDIDGNSVMRTKKRALHLSLKRMPQHKSDTDSNVPSITKDMLSPPIPPRKSKINRNRPVSERSRPKGMHFPTGSGDSSPSSHSPKSEFYTPPQTPSSSDGPSHNIPSSNSLLPNVNPNQDCDNAYLLSKSSANNETNLNNNCKEIEHLPSYEELLTENQKLKNDIAIQKERYKKDVTALRSQHTSLNQKYDNRIKTMEACFQNQKKELEMKLEEEKVNVAAAVDSTILLKEELMKYQLKYGMLSS